MLNERKNRPVGEYDFPLPKRKEVITEEDRKKLNALLKQYGHPIEE